MRWSNRLVPAAIAVVLLAGEGGAGARPRLQIGGPACETAAADLEARLHGALRGRAGSDGGGSVTFARSGEGILVTVSTHEEPERRGETALVVPTCEEAVDAAIVILALASTGGETPSGRSDPPGSEDRDASIDPPRTDASEQPSALVVAAPSGQGELERHSPVAAGFGPSRLSLAAGMDAGTLVTPTAVVSAGLSRSVASIDLGCVLRYGLMTENETAETGFRERVRREFGAVEVRACYGLGRNFRVSACTGGELGFVHLARRLVVDGAAVLAVDEVAPRFSGTLGAVFSARHGRIQPELELSGSALAFGRNEGSPRAAVRAAAGAAVAF